MDYSLHPFSKFTLNLNEESQLIPPSRFITTILLNWRWRRRRAKSNKDKIKSWNFKSKHHFVSLKTLLIKLYPLDFYLVHAFLFYELLHMLLFWIFLWFLSNIILKLILWFMLFIITYFGYLNVLNLKIYGYYWKPKKGSLSKGEVRKEKSLIFVYLMIRLMLYL